MVVVVAAMVSEDELGWRAGWIDGWVVGSAVGWTVLGALEGWEEVEDVVGMKVDWMTLLLLLFCTGPGPDPCPDHDPDPSSGPGPGCCRPSG